MYFSGQGRLYIASRDTNGFPGAFSFVGNVPELKVALTTEVKEHKESTTGQRLTDYRLITGKKAEVSFSLEEITIPNLVMALYGQATTYPTSPATITNELTPAAYTAKAGDYIATKNPNISAFTITDSAGTPHSLVAGTDYVITNAAAGTIQLIGTGLGTLVMPLKMNYTSAAPVGGATMFTQAVPERWIRFEGLNTANSDSPVLVELYRAVMDPLKELDLITDDFAKMDLTGTALYDAQRPVDANFGNFGRMLILG